MSETESECTTPKQRKSKDRIEIRHSPKSPPPPSPEPPSSHGKSHKTTLATVSNRRGSVLPAGGARASVPHHLSSHKRLQFNENLGSDRNDQDYVPSNSSSESSQVDSASDCELTMISKSPHQATNRTSP